MPTRDPEQMTDEQRFQEVGVKSLHRCRSTRHELSIPETPQTLRRRLVLAVCRWTVYRPWNELLLSNPISTVRLHSSNIGIR